MNDDRDNFAQTSHVSWSVALIARLRSVLFAEHFKFIRDLSVLSGGQFVTKLVGFAAFAFLARTLDPAGYGAIELIIGIAGFFTIIVDCGLGTIAVRRIAEMPADRSAIAAQVLFLRLTIALIAIPCMAFTVRALGHADIPSALVWLFAVSLLFNALYQDWLLQSAELMTQAAVGQALRVLTFAAMIVVFVRGTSDVVNVGVAELVAACVAAGYCLLVQHRRITPIRLHATRQSASLLREGIPIGLSLGVWSANQYAPLFLMGAIVAGAETGWFAGANRLVLTFATLSFLYHFNLYPALARAWAGDSEALAEILCTSFRVVAWFSIGLAFALTLAAGPVLALIYGSAFEAAGTPLAILIWTLPAMFLSGHARWALIVAGAQVRVLHAQLCGLALIILAGAPLIHVWGAVGAAIAALGGSAAVWISSHLFALRVNVPPPSPKLLARPFILALVIGSASYLLDTATFARASVALVLFFSLAPLFDRALLPDLIRLAKVKGAHPAHQPAE